MMKFAFAKGEGGRRQRRIALTLAVLLSLFVAVTTLLPTVIRLEAVSWLEENGVGNAQIVNVDLNLFTGSFAVEGMQADDGLRVGRFAVDIDWLPLLHHSLFVRSLQLDGVAAELHQQDDGAWQVSTIRIGQTGEKPQREADRAAGSGADWQVVLHRIEVNDVSVKAAGSVDGKPIDASIVINSLTVALDKIEPAGGQWLKSSLDMGAFAFDGFGHVITTGAAQLNQKVFLPPLGAAMANGWKVNGASLNVREFSLLDTGKDVQLLSAGAMQLDGVHVDAAKASFDRFTLRDIVMPSYEDDTLGKIGTASLQGGSLDFGGIYRLKKLDVDDLHLSLQRLKGGELLVLDRWLGGQSVGSAAGTAAPDVPAKKVPLVRIDEFTLGRESTLAYSDESKFPPFVANARVEELAIAPVDLSGKEPSHLAAQFRLNKNGELAVSGDMTLSAADPAGSLKIILKNFDMPGLSGFVEGNFGQSIKTGQMDLDSTVQIAANRIEAKNSLTIRKLELEKAKQPGRAEKSLGMPVNTALDMLRDKKGDIALDVPVTGRLDAPDIGIGQIVDKALISSISSGALTYTKIALQPYGGILMAAEFAVDAADKASKPKLTPIRFGDRSVSLDEDMSEYTGKIATLMQERDFRLQICGVATRLEGGGATPNQPQILSDERLLDMADKRSDLVMQAIQEKGIAADRLFNCRPSIDENIKEAFPRVEMILD